MLSRREVIRSGFFGAAAYLLRPWRAIEALATLRSSVSKRQFSWIDAEKRSEIEAVQVAPNGVLAVQVTRPLTAPGRHAGWFRPQIQPRGQIWLLDQQLDKPTLLDLGGTWAFAPCFSPSGERLAALVSNGDGRVGFSVWDLETHKHRLLNVNVDIYGKISSDGVAEIRPRGVASPRQFAWLDDNTLIFVDAGQEALQFDNAIASATRTYSKLRDRSANGEVAARVWGAASPTCGSYRSIASIDCNDGGVTTLHRGDVRGISISPNRELLAVLFAAGHIRFDPSAPMEPALRYTSVGDDPLVSLSLMVIGMSGRTSRVVGEFRGVGNVSPRRLPVWSSDSRRFAVASRDTYSAALSTGDDACWEVDTNTLRVQRWSARSALDAELLSSLLVCGSRRHQAALVENRPVPLISAESKSRGVGRVAGGAWRYGLSNVVLWANESITLIGTDAQVVLPGEFSDVYPPIKGSGGAVILAERTNGDQYSIAVSGLNYSVNKVVLNTDDIYLGFREMDASVLVKEDTGSGSSIFAILPNGRRKAARLSFNQHFSGVIRPERRELAWTSNQGEKRSGVLMLPVGRAATDRHPVVVWAYPDSVPSVSGPLTRMNNQMAVQYPVQFLLTQGYAVFHAPLSTSKKSTLDPIEMINDAVLPWLDVLDHQPEILAGEYGFMGHSNGGYAALALEGSTSRFKAIVASSTFPDLAANLLSSAMDKSVLNCAGQALQADRFYYEDSNQPYTFNAPFWQAQSRWLRNSPLYSLAEASTPLLLIVGEFDFSPRQMESVFSILYGRNVPVELVQYWGEGHVINSPGNLRDMWLRIAAFLGKHLKRHGARDTEKVLLSEGM